MELWEMEGRVVRGGRRSELSQQTEEGRAQCHSGPHRTSSASSHNSSLHFSNLVAVLDDIMPLCITGNTA
jgi:hypothetical protein